jgi:hypothetical protein
MRIERPRSESSVASFKGAIVDISRMIYSSITPYVHMLYTAEDDQEHIELDFSDDHRRTDDSWGYGGLGVGYADRFSTIANMCADLEYTFLSRWKRGSSRCWKGKDHGVRY